MSLAPVSSNTPRPPPQLPPTAAAQKPAPAPAPAPPPTPAPPPAKDSFEAKATTAAPKSEPATTAQPAPAVKPAELPAAKTGEDMAKDEVDVKTATDLRAQTEQAQTKLKEKATQQVDELFAMAAGTVQAPPGATVTRVSESEVQLKRVDDAGAVRENTRASRGANGAVNLDTATYDNGINKRDQVEALADGTTTRVRHAEWGSAQSEAGTLKSFEDFNSVRDANVVYSDAQVRKDGDTLVSEDFSQVGGGVKGSKTYFLMGQGDGGIDDKLDKVFDYKKPVGRADTYSYSIPPPGADGAQGNPQYQRVQRFSQEQAQVTSYVDRDLDGHKKFAGQGPHNRADLDSVRKEYAKGGGENYDADDGTKQGKTPKRWLAEVQKGPDAKETQTFLEGSPKATTTRRLEREGSTVREHFEGKGFKPNSSDLGEVKGDATRTYGQDGSLEAMQSAETKADGTQETQKYASTRQMTEKGLRRDETLETSRTKDGQTWGSKKEDSSLLSGEGAQLLASRSTVSAPDGRLGVSERTPAGQKFTLSGPGGAEPREVANLEALGADAVDQELVTQAGISTADTLQGYARSGGAQALKAFQGLAADKILEAGGGLADVLGKTPLEQGLQAAKGGAGALAGAAGVVSGGMQLAQGIQEHNVPSIFRGLADLGVGGLDLYTAGNSLYNATKGVSDLALDASDDLARTAGSWLGKATGLSALASTGAGAKVLDLYTAGNSLYNATKGVSDLALDASDDLARTAGSWLGKATGLSALASTGAGAKVLSAVKGLGGAANVVGAVVGTGTGIADIVAGARNGDGAQIAKGAVSIAGGLGGAAAVIAATSAFGGPIGAAVGAVVGLATFGITKIIDAVADKEHQIAGLQLALDQAPPSQPSLPPRRPAGPPGPR